MQTPAFDVVEGLLIEHRGAVRAHVVRIALEEQGQVVHDLGRVVEVLGFKLVDGFVVLPAYAT